MHAHAADKSHRPTQQSTGRKRASAVIGAVAAATVTATALALPASATGTRDSAPATSAARHGGTQQAALKAVTDAEAVSAIAEVRDGDKAWHGTAGVSELGGKRPVHGDGRFRIASVTKAFVATTALQLVGEGRLALDDSVESHLPGLVPNGQNITVRQLLSHRSGLFDPVNDGDLFPNDPAAWLTWYAKGGLKRTYTPHELVAKSVAHAPLFEPGTQYHYSNISFNLIGMIIDQVTGHSYAQEISRRVLRPLGMTRTTLPGASTAVPGPHAHGYWTVPDGTGKNTDFDVTGQNPSWAGAAGEMISTTSDLLRFEKALVKGKLLRPAQQREMTNMLPTGNATLTYGLGLASIKLSCTTVIGHNGEAPGFQTHLWGTADRQVALSYTPRGSDAEQGAQKKAVFEFLDTTFCKAP